MSNKTRNKAAAVNEQNEASFRQYCMEQYEDVLLRAARMQQEKDKAENPNAKARIRRNEWYSLKTNDNLSVTDALNTVEAMGFPVVNVIPAGFNTVYVLGRRVASIEIPDEVPHIDGQSTVTELPSLVTDEEARKKWEESEQA